MGRVTDGLSLEVITVRRERAIVRDYNGHLRIDQVDLDKVEIMEELMEKIYLQEKEIERLRKAWQNANEANIKIGNELNATRWELIEARKEIEKLTRISIDYEVVREEAEE